MSGTILEFLGYYFLCALCVLFHTVIDGIFRGHNFEQTMERLQNDLRVIAGCFPVCVAGYFLAVIVEGVLSEET